MKVLILLNIKWTYLINMWKAVFWMLSDKSTVRILQLGCDHVRVEAHPVQLQGSGKKLDFLIFHFLWRKCMSALAHRSFAARFRHSNQRQGFPNGEKEEHSCDPRALKSRSQKQIPVASLDRPLWQGQLLPAWCMRSLSETWATEAEASCRPRWWGSSVCHVNPVA